MDDSGYFSVQVCIESLSISVVLYIYIVDVYVVCCVCIVCMDKRHGIVVWLQCALQVIAKALCVWNLQLESLTSPHMKAALDNPT